MRKAISLMLGELQKKMSAYAALLNYRYMNLCVKAEPVSLLPVTVQLPEDEVDIEDVADITIPREDQLQVYPKDQAFLLPISKAIFVAHPEFKIEEVADENDEDEKTLLLTMPEVNKDRHDVLINGVDVLYEEAKAKLQVNFTEYSGRIVEKTKDFHPDEIKEAKDALEDVNKQHTDLIKQYTEAKKKEIEDAYQRYLTNQAQKETARKEEEAAHDEKAGLGMKLEELEES